MSVSKKHEINAFQTIWLIKTSMQLKNEKGNDLCNHTWLWNGLLWSSLSCQNPQKKQKTKTKTDKNVKFFKLGWGLCLVRSVFVLLGGQFITDSLIFVRNPPILRAKTTSATCGHVKDWFSVLSFAIWRSDFCLFVCFVWLCFCF